MVGRPAFFFGAAGRFLLSLSGAVTNMLGISAGTSYTPGLVIFSSRVAGLVFLSVIFQSFVAQSFQRITGSLTLVGDTCEGQPVVEATFILFGQALLEGFAHPIDECDGAQVCDAVERESGAVEVQCADLLVLCVVEDDVVFGRGLVLAGVLLTVGHVAFWALTHG